MPQTFSVSTSVSVVPAAPAAASAAPAAGAPVGPARDQDNSAPADFLGQLKTALKNLTKAVKQPAVVAEAAPQIAAAAQAPATDAPAAAADTKDAPTTDHKADALPDVLAALGFVPVPLAFAPQPAPALAHGAAASANTAAPSAPATVPLPVASAQASPIDLRQSAAAAPASPTPLDVSKLPQPDAHLPMPELPSALAKTHVAAPTTDAPAPSISTTPTAPTAPTTDPTPQTPAPAIGAPQGQPASHHAPTATGAAAVAPQAIGAAQQQSAQENASQHGHSDDQGQTSSLQAMRTEDTVSTPPVTAATPDAAIAAAAGSTIANSPVAFPQHVRPAEVVSQIAHQADLYRLPGNRGVRVQLHPEDLGGVEVTLRYGVGGALQLHINVEHAATGSLVQAGWSELRDALATQGISPDRLVMSVTAPASSSQLDFSGGGSGRQSDPGLANFAQSQSGQQRQDNSDQTGPRGWNGALDPTASPDDTQRVAATSAPTSRIDYRA